MSGLIRDIRFGFRQLLKRPVWTISIILVLALGAGANTTMFSGFEAWVLRPLDFPEPDRLVSLNESRPKLGQLSISVSPRNLGDWMEQQQSFEGFGIFRRHQIQFQRRLSAGPTRRRSHFCIPFPGSWQATHSGEGLHRCRRPTRTALCGCVDLGSPLAHALRWGQKRHR